MSFWQFSCAVAGYVDAHGGDDEGGPAISYPSDEEFERALSVH